MAMSQKNGTHHSLETECLAFIQSIASQKKGFSFHLSFGDFSCSFDYNGAVAPTTARTPAAVVKSRKNPSTRRRNKKRYQLYLESKRGGPTSGQAPQSFETHSKVTASDPRRVNQEVAEVEENWEVYTRKALVTGTNDTTENPDTAIPRLPSLADSERRRMFCRFPGAKSPTHSVKGRQHCSWTDWRGIMRAVRSMAKWRRAAVPL